MTATGATDSGPATSGPATSGTDGAAVWMLRINPMVRRRLADPDLAALLERAGDLHRERVPLAEAASDDLFRLIPASPEAARGPLLALRRDIHNDRGRRERDLPDGVPASVTRWAVHRAAADACQDRLRRTYGAALERERSMLRERLGEGNFLTTLAQSVPGVYDAACRYRDHATADTKDRKNERSLLQYLTRAMVRTSPYGRLTAVGLARPDPSGVAMDGATPETASGHLDVDRALFDYVVGGLIAPDPDPLMALPPTARVNGDAVTFFQVRPDALRRLSAPLNRPTRLLVELLDLGPCRRSWLMRAMASRLGLDEAAADRLLGIALGLGLLVTAWRGDEFVPHPVAAAQRDVEAPGAIEAVRLFQAEFERLGDATDTAGRLAARQRLNLAGAELSRRAQRPAQLAVNEDFVLDPLLVDPRAHRAALDDLAAVTELLAAFDRMHVVRALVAAALVERFGPGCRVPLVEHAKWLVHAVYRAERALAEEPDAPVGPTDGSLAMLAKVRGAASSALHRDLAGTDDACWSPRDVADLVADIPDRFRAQPASYGVVVQAHGGDLVVNDAYAGHGPMWSRFLDADRRRGGDAGARQRDRLQRLYGPSVRLLEDTGLHSLSINAHPPILDQVLDPAGWRGLRLAHDPECDAVGIVDGDGAPVQVLALGAQLPEIFPYPVRVATWLCSSGRVVLDVAGMRHAAGREVAPAATVAYPRLRIGRVILSRRRWYLGEDFPGRRDSADDVEYLLAISRWRAHHDVPAEVMLKSLFEGPTSWESLADTDARELFFDIRRRSKPQYVDLASALMTRVLPRLLERRPPGCVEEALPGLSEGGHAQEWMVEMTRPSGQARFEWGDRPSADGAGR